MNEEYSPVRKVHAAIVFVVVVVLWGSTFVAVKYCLTYWSPTQVVAGRYVFGALLLLPLAVVGLKGQVAVYRPHAKSIAHLALIGSVVPVGLMTWAQQSIPSSFAGVMASLAPMMTLLVGIVLFGLPSRPMHWAGVLLGSCGVALLRWGNMQANTTSVISTLALVAALLATMCWGLAAQNYRRRLSQLNALHTTALSFQIMGLTMLAILTFRTEPQLPVGFIPWLYLFGLGLLSAVAVAGYNWLIVQWGALRATSCTYVVPLVALGWGIADAEPLGGYVLLACCLIGAAMWAVRLPVKPKHI